ncbi:MAG: ankyrin repeat domain-containing protein [Granulosicoccus sp.]
MSENKSRRCSCSADNTDNAILCPRALIIEAAKGNRLGVRSHLNAGGHPDATVIGKPTALCYAALSNDIEMAWLLIKAGALLDYQDGTGNTPIIYAVLSGSEEVLDLLLTTGAKLTMCNQQGKSAADYAFCTHRNNFHIQQVIHNHKQYEGLATQADSMQITLH